MLTLHATLCTLSCRQHLPGIHPPLYAHVRLSQASPPTGEDQEGIKPKIKMLHRNGIGGILDYAAEDDMDADEGPASRIGVHEKVVARTFDYGSEDVCDGHMRVFMKSIEAAADAPGRGFAAIKVVLFAVGPAGCTSFLLIGRCQHFDPAAPLCGAVHFITMLSHDQMLLKSDHRRKVYR